MAYAVGPDGHRRLLGITLGPEEIGEQLVGSSSSNSWERGLSGVQLVIADEHAGLAAAVRRFLPEVRRQRCNVHLQRNVLAKVPHRLRKRVAREVAAVFRAPGLAESKKRLAEITARWHKELPEAVNVLERGFTAATQFYAFPEPHWARLRTTNSLERLHTEIKRRIRSAGAFPDRASALRLITAVALRTTAVWSERRYLDLTLLEPKGGSPRQPNRSIEELPLTFTHNSGLGPFHLLFPSRRGMVPRADSTSSGTSTTRNNQGRRVNVFYRTFGSRSNPALVILHGYPTSSYDFRQMIPYLEEDYFIAVLDFPGFGFSDKPQDGYSYMLEDDAKLADYFVRENRRAVPVSIS